MFKNKNNDKSKNIQFLYSTSELAINNRLKVYKRMGWELKGNIIQEQSGDFACMVIRRKGLFDKKNWSAKNDYIPEKY